MARNEGGSAFPIVVPDCGHGDARSVDAGMTLRDYFAAKALGGMLAYSYVSPMHGNATENADANDVAKRAYEYADAMLAARSK
jgi:hypothetical protein